MSDPKPTGISLETLEAILNRFAAELRKPADPTEKELAQEEQDRKMRLERAEIEKQKLANRKIEQGLCDHSREDGTGACVPVYDERGMIRFLICQINQCIIRPGTRPTGPEAADCELHIFDNQLFSRELRRALRRPAMLQ